jgi:hypothetical protein
VRVAVEEIFAGLPATTKEVVVSTKGSWLLKGRQYLIDAVKRDNAHYEPTICGSSGGVSEREIVPFCPFFAGALRGKRRPSWESMSTVTIVRLLA